MLGRPQVIRKPATFIVSGNVKCTSLVDMSSQGNSAYSAAFDAIDHDTLPDLIESQFGISALALTWS